MNTKDIGLRSVGAIIGVLLKKGYKVLLPIGENERYDLVTERNGKFMRVQCKSARLKSNGTIEFVTNSVNYVKGQKVAQTYVGQIEMFGVYCAALDKAYLVPIAYVRDCRCTAHLRVAKTKRLLPKTIRWAKDFEV